MVSTAARSAGALILHTKQKKRTHKSRMKDGTMHVSMAQRSSPDTFSSGGAR